jgi:hypothetical protein
MDSFKAFTDITSIDPQHLFLERMGGKKLELQSYHREIEALTLHQGVPQVIFGQFNIARNMALYSFFFYSLGAEVQLKACSVIEHALRIRANRQDLMLRQLLTLANEKNWLSDACFRHVKDPDRANKYCRSLERILPQQRNESAHGVPPLVWDCVGHIERCADLINQLFARPPKVAAKTA